PFRRHRLRDHQSFLGRARSTRQRARRGQGDRHQARARWNAGAASSGRGEILQGSRTHEVTAEGGVSATAPSEVAFDETGVKRDPGGAAAAAVAAAAIAFSAYQLVIAGFAPLSSQVTRSVHVGFLLLLAFLIYPVSKRANRERVAWYDAVLAMLGFALAFYHWVFEVDLIQRAGEPTVTDLAVGTVVVVLVFEASRRVLGIALPIVCGIFLAYGF